MQRAPWTDTGRLQNEIQSIRNDLRNKAENHELSSINCRLDSLEHTVRELGSTLDGVQHRLQQLEETERRRELEVV